MVLVTAFMALKERGGILPRTGPQGVKPLLLEVYPQPELSPLRPSGLHSQTNRVPLSASRAAPVG